jgi:hypothetical protein
MRRLPFLALLLCLRLAAAAQTAPPSKPAQTASDASPQAAPQISPQAAYDQAARPLDIVRRDPGNWSDVEQTALQIAAGHAGVECGLRSPRQFAGEDLLAFARLCAFGGVWKPVQDAATSYLVAYYAATPADKLTNFPNLATAFDYKVQADLHLNQSDEAFGTCQTMLRTVLYDDQVSEATNATIRYVQLIHTDQAIILLKDRQPILLSLISARATPQAAPPAQSTTATAATTAPAPNPATSAHPPLPIHSLYADAIQLPAMLQFDAKPGAAAASFAELEAALPPDLSPDDAILTSASRRQYKLIGSPLPAIATWAWLMTPTSELPRLGENLGAGTELFLFPEWCAQCVAMGKQFMFAALNLNQTDVRFFGMLAQTAPPTPPVAPPAKAPPPTPKPGAASHTAKPPSKPASAGDAPTTPPVRPLPAELLAGTPTLIVPSETVDTFLATDYPLVVATDHDGIVRALIVAPNTALQPGGLAEQLAQHIVSHWPPPPHTGPPVFKAPSKLPPGSMPTPIPPPGVTVVPN